MLHLKERRMIELGTINYDPTGLKISSTSRGKSGLLFDSKGKIDLNSPATRELDAGCPRLDTSPDSKLNFSLVCIEDVKDYQMTALIGSPEAFDEFGLDESLSVTSFARNKEGRDQQYSFCSSKFGQYVSDLALARHAADKRSSSKSLPSIPWSDCSLDKTTHSRGKNKGKKDVYLVKFTLTHAWVQYTESGLPIIQIDLGKL